MNTDNLLSCPKFLAWKKQVTEAGCTIGRISPLHVLAKNNGDLLFALIDAEVISAEGTRLPNIIFIRGDACLIVPLIRNRDTREERFLMIRQRRIGSGLMSLEFPAGMLDNATGNPRGVAAREFSEETGISIRESKLFPLCERKLFSSVGASDEGIFYYGCIKELDDSACRALAGSKTGNPEENEHIRVALVTRDEAVAEASSGQVRLGLFLFDEYRKRIRI